MKKSEKLHYGLELGEPEYKRSENDTMISKGSITDKNLLIHAVEELLDLISTVDLNYDDPGETFYLAGKESAYSALYKIVLYGASLDETIEEYEDQIAHYQELIVTGPHHRVQANQNMLKFYQEALQTLKRLTR